MYSSEAIKVYEEMLKTASPSFKFTATKVASEKVAVSLKNMGPALEEAMNYIKELNPLSKVPNAEFSREWNVAKGTQELKDLIGKNPEALSFADRLMAHMGQKYKPSRMWPWVLGTGAATGGLGFMAGRSAQDKIDEYKKLGYGAAGLGLGVALPYLYNSAKNKSLNALATLNGIPSDELGDFSSI